jgi:hypothetical protein
METAAGRLGVAQKRLGTRKRVTVFEPGDRGLAGTHSLFANRIDRSWKRAHSRYIEPTGREPNQEF